MNKTEIASVWHQGPPPHVGWWNASLNNDEHVWRWWTGKRWSDAINIAYNNHEPKAAACAATMFYDKDKVFQEQIQWTWYWPENARVPRVDPSKTYPIPRDWKEQLTDNQLEACVRFGKIALKATPTLARSPEAVPFLIMLGKHAHKTRSQWDYAPLELTDVQKMQTLVAQAMQDVIKREADVKAREDKLADALKQHYAALMEISKEIHK